MIFIKVCNKVIIITDLFLFLHFGQSSRPCLVSSDASLGMLQQFCNALVELADVDEIAGLPNAVA